MKNAARFALAFACPFLVAGFCGLARAQSAAPPQQLPNAQSAAQAEEAARQRVSALLSVPITPEAAAELAVMQTRARQYDQDTQLRITAFPLMVGADARRAWFSAVAAQEMVAYFEGVQAAADAASELAARMHAAGNLSELARLRESMFAHDAALQLARARQAALAEKEKLTRMMGISRGSGGFRIADRLPPIPEAIPTLQWAEQAALAERLDLVAAKQNVSGTAKALGLKSPIATVDVMQLGAPGDATQSGAVAPRFEFPLYDFSNEHPRAEPLYRATLTRAREVAIFARSEVRESHGAFQAAFESARRYRDEILPARRKISAETLLRYNGMLLGVFDLLSDAREQISLVTLAIAAQRDFWIAEIDFRQTLIGPGMQVVRTPTDH